MSAVSLNFVSLLDASCNVGRRDQNAVTVVPRETAADPGGRAIDSSGIRSIAVTITITITAVVTASAPSNCKAAYKCATNELKKFFTFHVTVQVVPEIEEKRARRFPAKRAVNRLYSMVSNITIPLVNDASATLAIG